MTYWEKWRVDIENIGVQFNGKKTENINQAANMVAVGKDGRPRMCRGFCDNCADCIFYSTENITCVRKAREWLNSEVETEKKGMTNKEKNKERFDELGLGDLQAFELACRIAVRKNGDVDLCDQIPCHDCIFGYGNCIEEAKKWLMDEAEPEKSEPEKKEEKMEKDEIKVGDTVKGIKKCEKKGVTGFVRRKYDRKNGMNVYGVHFDDDSPYWVFLESEIKKAKSKKTPPRIVAYRDGDTVTVKDLETGEEASAVCSKDDTFDLHTGAFIAMSRLTHFDTDIRLMRLKMEHLDSCISDIRMGFGALMGKRYKYPDFDEEEKAK